MRNRQGEYIGPKKWDKPQGMPVGRHSGDDLDKLLQRAHRDREPRLPPKEDQSH